MNIRIAAHILDAVAVAIAGGTVVFTGIGDTAEKNIVAVASLVALAITSYLTATSSGSAKPGPAPTPPPAP